jgi:hypothetical protein
VRRVEETQTLEVFAGCRQEGVQRVLFFFSKRLRSWRKLRKDRPLSSLKNNEDKL